MPLNRKEQLVKFKTLPQICWAEEFQQMPLKQITSDLPRVSSIAVEDVSDKKIPNSNSSPQDHLLAPLPPSSFCSSGLVDRNL